MQTVGNVSILGMFVMYFFTATFGYLTFYGESDDSLGQLLTGFGLMAEKSHRFCVCPDNTEAELLHTYSKVDPLDTLILCVRLAVLVAVTLTVPVVLFPVRHIITFI